MRMEHNAGFSYRLFLLNKPGGNDIIVSRKTRKIISKKNGGNHGGIFTTV